MKHLRIAFLVSGTGRTLQNFVDRIADGRLDSVRICIVVSSKPDALAVERARRARIPVEVVRPCDGEFDARVAAALDRAEPDLVLMGGFLHLWRFPERYEWRVMNIHPALLPKFGGKGMYGIRVHRAVLAAGERESGCTVHFVDHEYDHGPIILQRRVPVLPEDTPESLAERVFAAECEAYPEAVRMFQTGAVWERVARPGAFD